MTRKNRALGATRLIHWSMAVLIVGLLALGFYMANTHSYGFYALHKSLGVLAILLLVLRLSWRVLHPWQSSAYGTPSEKWVKQVHLTLLTLLAFMPLSGLCLSGFGGYGVEFFGVQLIPSQFDELGAAIPYHSGLAELGYIAHELVAYLFTALLVLHVLAALKHHFLDKDNTLKRMLGTAE
jgi:Cytochrome B561